MTSFFLRRHFIFSLGSAAFCIRRIHAQPLSTKRIGVLWHAGSADEESIPLAALEEGLRKIGYVVGQNVLLENRFPKEEPARFVSLAAELVRMKVDLLVTFTRQAALAAKGATSTIPILFLAVPDPVESKLVDNLAHPGGNVTGLASLSVELIPKSLELLNGQSLRCHKQPFS